MQNWVNDKRQKLYVYKIALVASLGGFLFGYDLVVIAGALPFLTDYFSLSPSMKGFSVSSAILGAISGPLVGLWMSDKIGRRKTMICAAVCFMLSTVGTAIANSIWHFAFWRFVGGIGIGLAMISSPIYIAELSPAKIRGSLVNVNQLSNVIGINMAVVVSYFLSQEGWGWRWMFGMQGIPVIFLLIGLFLIPASPRWLASKGRADEALAILSRINGQEKAKAELKEIQQELGKEEGTFKDLFKPGVRLALIIGVVLMIFSQINGVNMMLLYGPTILKEAGIDVSANAILSSIPIYIFIFICTVVAFPLINRYSRRGLLITSVLLMALGHLIMAINLQLSWAPFMTLIPMLIGTGSFTLGLAPLSWIIVSEIFPYKVRGKALSIVCFFLYLASFLTAQMFPVITDWFASRLNDPAGTYWIFASICLLCGWFTWKYIPETKGLSLERISDFWLKHEQKKSNPSSELH